MVGRNIKVEFYYTPPAHKTWWETLKGAIFGAKPSIPALWGPRGGLLVAPAEKTLLLGSQFDSKQCREQFVTPVFCFSLEVQYFGLPNLFPPTSASRS